MKKCNICNQDKQYLEFSKNKNSKDGYNCKCKACAREYFQANKQRESEADKRRYNSRKDGLVRLYHLPNHTLKSAKGYVGCTESPIENRIRRHVYDGRNIEGYIILAESNDRNTMLRLEKEYHNNGYDGRHRFNQYK